MSELIVIGGVAAGTTAARSARPAWRFLPRAIAILLIAVVLLTTTGCNKGEPKSENYFALAEGNSWLFEGGEQGAKLTIEIKVTRPDPSLNLGDDMLDLSITGSLGALNVSEEGLFLQAATDAVKLWGVKQMDAPPVFFDSPYIWLEKPLEVGREYSTAVSGQPVPTVMRVTEKTLDSTPWGEADGFLLVEKSGAGTSVVFVPYLGFTTVSIPDWPVLTLKDAGLR